MVVVVVGGIEEGLFDAIDDEGLVPLCLARSAGSLDPIIAPSAESATEDAFRERFVAVPLTSLSDSAMGSRLMNSLCSNCTTTYGRASDERTLSARAWMTLTWICPLEAAGNRDDGF